jgi:hypothetical protein
LLDKYPELQKNAELVNDVWNSFDASGFLSETDAINEALNNIQIDQLDAFRKKFVEEYSLIEDDTQKRAARSYYQSVISGMIPKDATDSFTKSYLDKVTKDKGIEFFSRSPYKILKNAIGTDEYANEAVLRILADPSLAEMTVKELQQQIEDTKAEIKIEANEEGIKNTISEIQSLVTKDSTLKEFESRITNGTGTTEDLLSILSDYP